MRGTDKIKALGKEQLREENEDGENEDEGKKRPEAKKKKKNTKEITGKRDGT